MFACLHGTGNLTALAFEFSPIVEATGVLNGSDTVTFDVSGLDRLFGLPQDVAAAIARRAREIGVKANLALAGNPDAAICAARGFPGVSLIPHGDEGKFLATLPLALLSPAPQLLETLERWGIRRFHEMAALPPLGIAERLGTEGLRLRELARGEGDRKLLPLVDALHFEDEIELDYPVELLEPLAFLLARLINGLATRLATRGLATDELRLRFKLETSGTHERCLRLPVPSLDTKAFLKLLQLDLEAHPPAGSVVHQRTHLSAAGRIARGLSEPLPPGHAHEAARPKGRRRSHPGGARRIRPRPDLHHPDPDERLLDIFGRSQSLCRTPAPLPSRRGGPQPGRSSSARAGFGIPWSPPTASPTPLPRSASCSTSSPASATMSRSPTPDACWSATPSAT